MEKTFLENLPVNSLIHTVGVCLKKIIPLWTGSLCATVHYVDIYHFRLDVPSQHGVSVIHDKKSVIALLQCLW